MKMIDLAQKCSVFISIFVFSLVKNLIICILTGEKPYNLYFRMILHPYLNKNGILSRLVIGFPLQKCVTKDFSSSPLHDCI